MDAAAGGRRMARRKRDAAAGAELAGRLRAAAAELGFSRCGIASADASPDPERLRSYLARGDHAGMAYLARSPEVRLDPARFLPGVRSVVSVACNYFLPDLPDSGETDFREREGGEPGAPRESAGEGAPGAGGGARPVRIARYAWGPDYHAKMRARLEQLLERVSTWVPGVRGRIAVDSAPVLERHWAAAAGVGWIGRNTCLIVPGMGSWVFLGELFLDLALVPDAPLRARCGRCRRCLDACPSGALVEPFRLDARRCIAYWTIEHRGAFPPAGRPRLDPWLFGCDACQEACPWNRFALPSGDAAHPAILASGRGRLSGWMGLTRERYAQLWAGTALARAGFEGLLRNAKAIREDRAAGAPGSA